MKGHERRPGKEGPSDGAPKATETKAGPSAPTLAPVRAGPLVLAILLYAAASLPPLLMRVLYLEAFETDGPSMEPSFLHGDGFVIDRSAIGLFFPWETEARASWGVPEVGDVVVVRSPLDEVDIVKRVIGLPGDRLEIRDDEVLRNGVSLGTTEVEGCPSDEVDLGESVCVEEHVGERRWRTLRGAWDGATMSEREVPSGHVFVLGDHRNRSNDSRRIGPIPLSRVIGVARFRYRSPAGLPLGSVE